MWDLKALFLVQSVEYLKDRLTDFGGKRQELQYVVGIVRLFGYPVSEYGMIGRGHSNGCVQELLTFLPVSLTEIHVELHDSGEVGKWTGM